MRAVLIVVSLAAFSTPRATAQVATHSCSSLPLATFSYDRALPLDVSDSVAKTQDGVEIHAISFASPRGGRATGLLFIPGHRLPGVQLPGLVMQHGMPGKAEYVSWVSGNIAYHGSGRCHSPSARCWSGRRTGASILPAPCALSVQCAETRDAGSRNHVSVPCSVPSMM